MKILLALADWIDCVNEKAGTFAGWLSTLMVLVVCYDVFTRYLLKASSIAVQELEWHLFSIIFLVAAAFTLKHDRHVRVDVLYHKFSSKAQAWVNLLGSLLFLIPFTILAIVTSWSFVAASFRIREISPDPGGLPGRYILKAFIVFGFALLLLQGLSLAVRSLREIRDPGNESHAGLN